MVRHTNRTAKGTSTRSESPGNFWGLARSGPQNFLGVLLTQNSSTLQHMIDGAHVIVYSKDAEADRAFFRDVLGYPFVDAGHGWLIFALPPAELAVHPSEASDAHELYFTCRDIQALVAELGAKGVACSALHEERWGSATKLTLPGGGRIVVYQRKHPSPLARSGGAAG